MKKSIITLAVGIISLCTLAAPVDRHTARQAAESFVTNTLQFKGDTGLTDISARWNYSNMYLFSFGGGYIVTAADDAARPILAYSLDGAFEPKSLSMAQKGLLDTYEAEIAMARRDGLAADPAWKTMLEGKSLLDKSKDIPESVGPLVTTRWGQYAPYNGMCPSNVPSGCVATATSQVMRYWNYPAFGQGSHSYNCATFGNLSADFAHTRYDWAHMPETGATSAEERTALATLTFHVGVSVNMDYNYTQSGATTGGGDNCALEALRRYFHYNSSDIRYHSKGSMSDSAWADFLRAELRRLRPILYDGTAGAFGGHSFICDGYDSLGFMHFNFGWSGEGDGYYAIGAITPGIGPDGSHIECDFSSTNQALLGAVPVYALRLSDTVRAFRREGGSDSVLLALDPMNADTLWNVSCDADWLTLAHEPFSHVGWIVISATENNSGAQRSATILFHQSDGQTALRVVQDHYSTDDYCPVTVVMHSRRGNGWLGGARLTLESEGGLVYGTAQMAGGTLDSVVIPVPPQPMHAIWHSGGGTDRFAGYTLRGPDGNTLFHVENAYLDSHPYVVANPCSNIGIDEACLRDSTSAVVDIRRSAGWLEVSCRRTVQELTIVDPSGRTLYRRSHMAEGHPLRIDTAAWPTGIYMIRVVTGHGVATRRILLAD